MSDTPAKKRRGPGKPFTQNDPRRSPGGRPRKTVTWKEAEDELREAIPRILLMPKNELQRLLAENPTGVEMLAAKYIHEYAPKTVERFLGKTPVVLTGEDGAPLIPAVPSAAIPALDFGTWKPEQIDAFIAATAHAVREKKSA